MKVGIVGLGLIGASIALSLKDKVEFITGFDRDKEVIKLALERKIIDEGGTEDTSVLSEVDVVILALYPDAIIDFVLGNSGIWKENQLLMDVAGLKSKIVNTIQDKLVSCEFIGTHPMAGREVSGIKSAREELFLGSNFIITPTNKNTVDGISKVKGIAKLLGVKNIYEMSPEKHDELIAYTSHIPHLFALSLIEGYEIDSEKIVGRSFLDSTRVADINEKLWIELFIENKVPLVKKIEEIVDDLNEFKILISNEDDSKLEEKIKGIKGIKERIKI